MIGYFLLGIALLIGVLLVGRWYVSAPPKTLAKGVKWLAFGIAVLAVLWLAATGRLWAAVAALPAIALWFARLFTGLRYMQMLARLFGWGGGGAGWRTPGSGGGPSGGRSSDVRTRFVAMRLDHATGHVSGEVLEGRFAGRALDTLGEAELLDLYAEARVDADSARVLEGYLDRRMPDWRNREAQTDADPGTMTREQAYKVLGLEPGASRDEIKAAHRRLMAAAHPDHGGSDFLAQQINRAKDVLLGD
ncbi:MAG: DnaJ domain-containing protein [Alphaproteobacteria bacterium]|nr:DnaJ domain-containing protein [Alphaproteobacteria bacterium]MBF0251138.1 DnaJ domain-containing protein [Alphaproteobacteria bacterium]